MKIEAHIICWNEEKLLPFTIAHYKKFCSRIIIYDNFSTDRSPDIARENGCEVVQFGIKGTLDDLEYLNIKNNVWKKSDADWVIVCDTDELLWHPRLMELLEKAKENNETIFQTYGWNVYADVLNWDDLQDITEIRRGVFDKGYSKKVIFDPKALYEINYKPGAHVCDPVGDVNHYPFPLFLLHYRNIEGADAVVARRRLCQKRLSHRNRVKGWGTHYGWSERKIRDEYETRFRIAEELDPLVAEVKMSPTLL